MTSHEREKLPRRRILEIGAGLGLVAIVAGCSAILPNRPDTNASPSSPEHEKSQEVDLLRSSTWEYMPGAKEENNSLRIFHTGLEVRTLEEDWENPSYPEYIATPPQNTYGTYVDMSKPDGGIGLTVQLSDLKGKAVVSFQTKPTYHYDERTYNHAGIDVIIENSLLTVNIWQEGQTKPSITRTLVLNKATSSPHFSLMQTAKETIISSDNQTINMPETKILTSGEIWFGMNASDSWKLDSLKAFPLDGNSIKPVDVSKINFGTLNPNGLQAAVSKTRPDLSIGTAVDPSSLFSNPHLTKLVTENFGSLSTEMLAKPQALQPKEDHFVWNEFDGLLDFAKRHNKQVHLHTLIFGEANPKWLEDKLQSASSTEALALMRKVIEPVASRSKGKVQTIDVINEPFDAENWDKLRQHLWMKPLGPAYIDHAFRITHATNPEALLGINEWALESDDDRWNAMISLAKGLRVRGVPIHYIGFQGHFDEETLADSGIMNAILNGDQLEKRFKTLEELGLKVRISEISVAGADKNLQARVYAVVLKACKNAPNCIGFTMWGAASNAAYFTSEPNASGQITPTEFGDDAPWQQNKDGTYSEKPAVAAMKTVQ